MSKTFLLGVGCQRGGTTWLHDYLSTSPQVDFGFTKEYHVWDALHVPRFGWFRERVEEHCVKILELNPSYERNPFAFKWLDFYRHTDNYFDYFDYLHYKNEATRLVGDITPSYSALPTEVLVEIRESLAARGFRAKAVFIMRDPVERVWSSARLNMMRSEDLSDESVVARVEEEYLWPKTKSRGRYNKTLKNLSTAFPKEDRKVLLYEELFSPKVARRITDFLEIDPIEPDFDTKVNASTETSSLPEELQSRIAQEYAASYRAAAKRFGEDRIRSRWSSARFVDLS